MKKFSIRVVGYGCLSLLLLGLTTLVVDHGLRQINSDMFGDWNRLFNNEINDDIVVVGNSRARVHFNPIIIEEQTGYSCYNLGKDATNLFQQQTVINAVLAHVKPKYLVISLDIGSFQNNNKILEKEQYLPYINNPDIYPVLSEIDENIKFEKIVPVIKYRGQSAVIFKGIRSIFLSDDSYSKSKGFVGRNEKWNSDFDAFKKLMKNDKIILSKEEIEDGLKLLADIAKKCKANNVELIFCQTPRYHELYSYFPQKEAVDTEIKRFAIKNNILFIDFTDDELSNNRNMFYNASHLNATGANKLSHKFSTSLNAHFSNY